MSKKHDFLTNVYEFILYPNNIKHIETIDLLSDSINIRFVGILHDKDVYSDFDYNEYFISNKNFPIWKVGDKKISHYHFLVYFQNAISINQIIELYPLNKEDINFCYSEKEALKYLLHRGHEEKYQYNLSEVLYNDLNLFNKLKKYISQFECSNENLSCSKILEYISNFNGYLSNTELSRYILTHDLWSVYRRGFSVFSKILNEHNQTIVNKSDLLYRENYKITSQDRINML